MKQYTILHTIESGGPGGAETVVLNLVKKLNPERFKSIVLLPPGPWLNPRLRELGVPVIEVSWKVWYDPSGPLAMIKAVRKCGIDLIHSHLPGQNFYSCIAGTLTRRKTLVTYHGPVEFHDGQSAKGKAKLWFVKNTADRAIVVCKMVKEILVDHGFHDDRISVIYNGIDPAPHMIGTEGTGTLRSELGLGPDDKLVGMVANVRQSKGYDVLVKACAEVSKQFPRVTFVAVGDVLDVLAQPIKKLVDELSLADRFVFLGFRSDIPNILRDLDVFVLASTSEGMPLAVLEAMASRKAMVATRCGGIPEVVDDGQTGLLVPPSDPSALARAIRDLLSDRSRALRLGANAQAKFQKEFTLDGMVQRYERLYLSQLEGD
jgi:glycosyltransferase involved in cell wall biosynthesis